MQSAPPPSPPSARRRASECGAQGSAVGPQYINDKIGTARADASTSCKTNTEGLTYINIMDGGVSPSPVDGDWEDVERAELTQDCALAACIAARVRQIN